MERKMWKNNNLLRENEYRESKLSVCYIAVGAGCVFHYNNSSVGYKVSDTYNPSLAKRITGFIRRTSFGSEDLAQYISSMMEGVESIKFVAIWDINIKYYTIWKVTYDPEIVDINEIGEYLIGQMTDGWGESLEQVSFGKGSGGVEYYFSPYGWNEGLNRVSYKIFKNFLDI